MQVLDHYWAKKRKTGRNEQEGDKDSGSQASWGPGAPAIEPQFSFPPHSASGLLFLASWLQGTSLPLHPLLLPASDSGPSRD